MFYVKSLERLTISVGQQLYQAVQTRVPHLSDVGGTAANGLDCGSNKVFIHAFNVCLPGVIHSDTQSLCVDRQKCTFVLAD